MTTAELDHLCAMAMQRITITINRSAGQHLRALRAAWAQQDKSKTKTPGGAA